MATSGSRASSIFQSTPLIRGATARDRIDALQAEINFNPRPSYEERLAHRDSLILTDGISIHAPHTRSDGSTSSHALPVAYFNPRPSYEERPSRRRSRKRQALFQSTPLIRGATLGVTVKNSDGTVFQSTPLIRGATFRRLSRASSPQDFNPRPSYEERLHIYKKVFLYIIDFNPRPSYEERLLYN